MLKPRDQYKKKEDYVLACAQELALIRKDPNYFITNYIKFDALDSEKKTISMYDEQKKIVSDFVKDHFVIILGTRQCGKTAIMEAICVWLLIAFNNYDILHLNRTGTNASTVVREIKSMLDSMPEWLKPTYLVDNTQHIKLGNGSSIKAEPSGGDPKNKGRGLRPLLIWIDETSFCPNADELSTAVFPGMIKKMMDAQELGLPYGIALSSTPNGTIGAGAYFHNIWQQAIDGRSQYKATEIYWKNLPDRSREWYEMVCSTILNNDQRKINQEMELKFLGSSTTMLSDEIISQFKKEKPLRVERTIGGDIWWFEEPAADQAYIIGIDTATEHGTDYSSCTVWDYDTLEQIADYRGKCKIKDYMEVIKKLDKDLYGRIILIPERNGVGNQTVEELEANEFLSAKLFYTTVNRKGNIKVIKGLNTTTLTRPLMIDSLYNYCKDYSHLIKSERLIGELVSLERKASGKIEACSGMTDDLAMSFSFVTYAKAHHNLAEFKPGGIHWSADKDVMKEFDGSVRRQNALMSEVGAGPVDNMLEQMQFPQTQLDGQIDLSVYFEEIQKQLNRN